MKIILASASPRRKELLLQVGLDFEVRPSFVQEKMKGDTPKEVVKSLAEQKAMDIFDRTDGCALVIGADTIVVCDGERLGKPSDEADALSMLSMLSGRGHQVYTGVCFIYKENGQVCMDSFAECTDVYMYDIPEEQARWYVSTGEPLDKAGAYGIQGIGAVFIREIKGDYNNVVGLPLAKVWQYLSDKRLICTDGRPL